MRLQLVGQRQQDLAAAADAIEEVLREWGEDVSIERASAAGGPEGVHKGMDPVSVAALVLAIPSAVLAVLDIADRIRKRRRAKQLVARAEEVRITFNVEVSILAPSGPQPVAGLDPDRLLALAAGPEGDH